MCVVAKTDVVDRRWGERLFVDGRSFEAGKDEYFKSQMSSPDQQSKSKFTTVKAVNSCLRALRSGTGTDIH
jgi:hypothetical protein